jgi:hypothetical protein
MSLSVVLQNKKDKTALEVDANHFLSRLRWKQCASLESPTPSNHGTVAVK